MGYKVGYEIPLQRLEDLKKECRFMIDMCNTVIPKRQELIAYGGNTDYEYQKLNSKYNPEDYYKFRLWDRGCEIILTSYRFDEVMQKFVRSKEHNYAIRYYNCRSKVFEDKRTYQKYNTDNTSYGQFEKLEEAVPWFRLAVVDILRQFGFCSSLDPIEFIKGECLNGLSISN